jgi:hypothetical protein
MFGPRSHYLVRDAYRGPAVPRWGPWWACEARKHSRSRSPRRLFVRHQRALELAEIIGEWGSAVDISGYILGLLPTGTGKLGAAMIILAFLGYLGRSKLNVALKGICVSLGMAGIVCVIVGSPVYPWARWKLSPPQNVSLQNEATSYCLTGDAQPNESVIKKDADGVTTSPSDGRVFTAECGPNDDRQRWNLTGLYPTGSAPEVNRSSGLCLDTYPKGGGMIPVPTMRRCLHTSRYQLWELTIGNQLRNQVTKLCLTAADAFQDQVVVLTTEKCDDDNDYQQWTVVN